MRREEVRLRLGESRLRIALSLATPPLLVLLAWVSWLVAAPVVVVAVLAVLAALLGYVAAFDFPLAIEVDADGIHRISLLRRQLTPWSEIASITRPRKKGLILVTNDDKRHILLDRAMGNGELDLLREQARLRDIRPGF
jgi:hypothetical protein